MCFKSCREASLPRAKSEGLSSWEERGEGKVIGDEWERRQRVRSCWTWMVTVMTKDLDFMQRLGGTRKV